MACASIFGFAWHYSHIIMTGAYNSLIHSVVNTFSFYAIAAAAAGLTPQIERRSSRLCTLYRKIACLSHIKANLCICFEHISIFLREPVCYSAMYDTFIDK